MKTFLKTVILSLGITAPFFSAFARTDSVMIRKIYSEALVAGESYDNLRYLCKEIGPRLSGSENAEKAIRWTKKIMESYGIDSVWLQPVMVPKWERGSKEVAKILGGKGSVPVKVTSLGNSFGTGKRGITGEVIEVKSLEELTARGKEVEGKIVFINQPMPLDKINTFESYSETGAIRFLGPKEAAKHGAIGVIVRSLSTGITDFPHTGTTDYGLNVPKIPAVAISTKDAELLSGKLSKEKGIRFYLKNDCRMLEDVLSYNVVGEIRGTEFPDEIIVIGGHLDSWDLAEGAHDDGAGMIHALEATRILKKHHALKRTMRVVMFINEENGLAGGKEYADLAETNEEKHVAGLESDSGGFLPLGFSIDAKEETIEKVVSWKTLFEPYNVFIFEEGYGGADINPLKNQDVPLFGLRCDSQRYFEIHHNSNDVFENVNKRELELGSATLASMIYLIDKYGL